LGGENTPDKKGRNAWKQKRSRKKSLTGGKRRFRSTKKTLILPGKIWNGVEKRVKKKKGGEEKRVVFDEARRLLGKKEKKGARGGGEDSGRGQTGTCKMVRGSLVGKKKKDTTGKGYEDCGGYLGGKKLAVQILVWGGEETDKNRIRGKWRGLTGEKKRPGCDCLVAPRGDSWSLGVGKKK